MYVLITYDISTVDSAGKSRLQVAKVCQNYGQRVQNSVFECKVDPAQCKTLELKLEKIIDETTDSLRFYYLGKTKELKVKHVKGKAGLRYREYSHHMKCESSLILLCLWFSNGEKIKWGAMSCDLS